MTTQIGRLARRQAFALAAVLALVLGMIMFAPTSYAQETEEESTQEPFTVSDAEFRWGLNEESLGRSHQPGALNFLSAGDLLDAPQPITESSWKNTVGNVVIEKRGSSGGLGTASWADTATDQAGEPLTLSSRYSGLEVLFRNGKGSVDPVAGTAKIEWSGTASVIYYSGLVRMLISDPELEVTKSGAKVTATMEALESDQATQTVTGRIPPRSVTLANLTRNCVDLTGDNGFSVSPEFKGVKYEWDKVKNETPQTRTGSTWGAFPESFMKFVSDVGYAGFWYSTSDDSSKKVPLPISIGWDATKSDGLKEVCESSTASSSKGLLGQVIESTVEDILWAAGTDVSDTAAAWMDEAWKPLQPDAVNAAKAEAEAAAAAAGATGEVVSQVDAEFEEYYEEYYSAGAPITAGTVAATVASIPASTSRSAAAPASAPAANSADQATVQMAATSPLYGADVVYAQTSAISDAGSSSGQWQWWVGAALLAVAAMLFFQTVRRKD